MFEDQLLLAIGLQQNSVFVEALDPARQLHAAQQKDIGQCPIPPESVQKLVLDIIGGYLVSGLLFFGRGVLLV